MRRHIASNVLRHIAIAAAFVSLAACGGKHHLNQYQFSDRTLALVFIEPPDPQLRHGWLDVDPNRTTVQQVLSAGAGVAKEVEARRALRRFDSASVRVDVRALLAQQSLERASRYLGTRQATSPEGADFLLEVNMREIGIDARSNNATYLYAKAEAVLIDRRTGREIWSEDVDGHQRLTAWILGNENAPSAIFTAVTLHTVTVQDFQRALEQLASYTSAMITDELRDDLRDARDR